MMFSLLFFLFLISANLADLLKAAAAQKKAELVFSSALRGAAVCIQSLGLPAKPITVALSLYGLLGPASLRAQIPLLQSISSSERLVSCLTLL